MTIRPVCRAVVAPGALALILPLTALPIQASPLAQSAQPGEVGLTLHLVQTTAGSLFLTAGPNAWPVRPDEISDDDLAALTFNEDSGSMFPFLIHPVPQVIAQAGDGRLYLVHFHDVWPLEPDPIGDTELSTYALQRELQGAIPQADITDQPLGPNGPPAGTAGAPALPAPPRAAAASPTQAAPTGAASPSNLSRFVGVWEGHQRRLEVHADGSASLVWANPAAPDLKLTLKFTTATSSVATGQVVASNSPLHPVGQAATLTLNENDTVSPALGGEALFDFCGPRAPSGTCGA